VFIKLVVLILVCGSSGVGLLSVRQSRLQAAHEMAEARHRTQRLNEQISEIRAQIAQACTPDQVNAMLLGPRERMLAGDTNEAGYDPAIHHPAQFEYRTRSSNEPELISDDVPDPTQDSVVTIGTRPVETPTEEPFVESPQEPAEEPWVLDDGTRVILIGN